MPRITPHLWFDDQAVEAAELYCSVFPDSRVTNVGMLHDTPAGDTEHVSFQLCGQPFQAISAGPLFEFNPSISFMVACETVGEVDGLYDQLAAGGATLMPLDAYPFSQRYAWIQDRYGLSWQLMHAGEAEITQRITPMLLFVGEVCGRAEEAIELYTSVFPDSRIGALARYGPDHDGPDAPGTLMHAGFSLDGQQLAAMDSAHEGHDFSFNEAVSLMVGCEDQEEIDHYWQALSAVPEAEQCGWLKDRFGVSWQVVPTDMDEMLTEGTPEQIAAVTQAFLPMGKLEVAELRQAYQEADARSGGKP